MIDGWKPDVYRDSFSTRLRPRVPCTQGLGRVIIQCSSVAGRTLKRAKVRVRAQVFCLIWSHPGRCFVRTPAGQRETDGKTSVRPPTFGCHSVVPRRRNGSHTRQRNRESSELVDIVLLVCGRYVLYRPFVFLEIKEKKEKHRRDGGNDKGPGDKRQAQ